MRTIKEQKGFIAITSVLIIGALILILGISIFHASLTDQSISSSYDSKEQASILADACAREAVFKLKNDINYSGNESIDINPVREPFSNGVNGENCSINPIENINDYSKKISTLVRLGDWPHFKRAEKEIRYVVESKADDWMCDSCVIENLEVVNDSLILPNELTSGYRISAELDISGQGAVKNSQMFWQADTRLGALIIIETRFYNGEVWTDWQAAVNGAEVPELSKGVSLETALIQVKAIFTGNPEFYPKLKNINIFIEINE